MPLNPGNFLFPIQNLGPDIGKFFEGYNTQQKRGEERERALAENAMARLKLERAPRQLDAELRTAEGNADYIEQQARYYPTFIQAQVDNLTSQGRLHEAQTLLANYDLQLKQTGTNALQQFDQMPQGNQGQAPQPLQPAQPVQPGQAAMPNITNTNPFAGSKNYGGIENTSQDFEPAGDPMERGEAPAGAAMQKGITLGDVSQKYQKKGSGANNLYEAVKQNPSLGFALQSAGYKIPDVESKADIARTERIAKAYTESAEAAHAARNTLETIHQAQDIIASLPAEAREAIGPINSLMTKYTADPAVQRSFGALVSLSRDLQKDYAKQLGPRATNMDLQLASEAKYDEKTPIEIVIGKLSALEAATQTAANREDLRADLLDKGYSEHESDSIVRKEYPLTRISDELKRLNTQEKNAGSIRNVTLDQVRAEKARRQGGQ